MTPSVDQEAWLDTFQAFMRYYVEPVDPSPMVNLGSLAAVLAGALLVFRCWKFERFVVASLALIVGAWAGYWLSLIVGTPKPITAAAGAVMLTVLAYRTYRWWLACGSVAVLFLLALTFQLGRGDLQRYLPDLNEGLPPIKGDMLQGLPSAAQQQQRLHPDWSDRLSKLKRPVERELKTLGPVGWLLPAVAAILGGLLAYWALRAFAVVLGLIGAVIMVTGGAVFTCAHWANAGIWLIGEPQYPLGAAIGLWLLGLVLQAKEARIPNRKESSGSGAKDTPKS
jgi:uncharacterized membrane protein YraQ (UPF0718 family)